MVTVDTNVVVRFLTRDDEDQYRAAKAVFSRYRVFIPDTVLLETEWVLRYAYAFPKKVIGDALIKLLGLSNVQVRNAAMVAEAIAWQSQGLDFADALHLAAGQDHQAFLTFDKDMIKRAGGLARCAVRLPAAH